MGRVQGKVIENKSISQTGILHIFNCGLTQYTVTEINIEKSIEKST